MLSCSYKVSRETRSGTSSELRNSKQTKSEEYSWYKFWEDLCRKLARERRPAGDKTRAFNHSLVVCGGKTHQSVDASILTRIRIKLYRIFQNLNSVPMSK